MNLSSVFREPLKGLRFMRTKYIKDNNNFNKEKRKMLWAVGRAVKPSRGI